MTTAAIALPPMHDLVLDGAAVDQLFFDLVQAATAIEIIARAPGARRADPAAPWTIDTAHAALRTGALAAVQLRYDFAGSSWCDTLLRTPAGFRLVRIDHTRALACRESDDA